jgi:hypothetical protein
MKKEKLVQFIREGETGYKCFICNKAIDELDLVTVSKKFELHKHDICEGKGMCFVCRAKLKASDEIIKLDKDLYRHKDCEPGSPPWLLKFRNVLTEQEYKRFLGGGNGETDTDTE